MERICTQPKMSKINLNCMSFEIKLSMKGEIFKARSSSLIKIENIKNARPEACSKQSFESAIQNLITKIEAALEGTNKKIGKIFVNNDGKVMYFVENIIYENSQEFYQNTASLNNMIMSFTKLLENRKETLESIINNDSNTIISFKDVILEWQQHLNEITKKPYDDEDYFSPTT